MPNGQTDNGYNQGWCNERHERTDKALEALGKSLGAIQTDIATIKTTLAERDKGNTFLWKLIPIFLALAAGGGGGLVAAKTVNPPAEVSTQAPGK